MARSLKTRGPKRSKTSVVKMRCALKTCRSPKDVKNIAARLRVRKDQVLLSKCRAIKANCAVVRFCCLEHLQRCRAKKASRKQGPRETLDHRQLPVFFQACLNAGYPWLAVLTLLQCILAERADAARQCRVQWFENLDVRSGNPPKINWEKVNGKSTARPIPLPDAFAQNLFTWMYQQPLEGAGHTRWPFPGQDMQLPASYLVPGMNLSSHKRDWTKPISERGYLKAIGVVANLLEKERQAARAANTVHPMDGVDLEKLGTHTFKASGVTIMKDHGHSTKVVSAISATTPETLEKFYERATPKRQRQAVNNSFASVCCETRAGSASGSMRDKPTIADTSTQRVAKFCSQCGTKRGQLSWSFCPICGHRFGSHD